MVSVAASDNRDLVAGVLAKHWGNCEPAVRTDLGVSRVTWRVGQQFWLSQSEARRSAELIRCAEVVQQIRRFFVEKRVSISVPEILATENGQLVVTDSGYTWCLTRHLQGFHPDSGDPNIYPVLTEGLVHFHDALHLFSADHPVDLPYGICVRTRQNIERLNSTTFVQFTNFPGEQELLAQAGAWLLRRLDRLELLPRQMIHGDWTPQNVMFDSVGQGPQLAGVLDFEFIANDPVHVDLAHTCSTLLMWSGLDKIKERIGDVLGTYERLSGLSLDREDVYAAMLAHWLSHYWSWRDRLENGEFGQKVRERLCLRIASVLDFVCSVSDGPS